MIKKIIDKYYQFGFKKVIGEYKNYSKDENSLNNTFDPGSYKRLKDWHCWDEKEFIQKLDERIEHINQHIKMVVEFTKTLSNKG